MSDSWQASVVLIRNSNPDNKDSWGTGFSIYWDGQTTYVVTCAHVVRDVRGPDKVIVDTALATLAASGVENGIDLAVLRVEGLRNKPPLSLRRTASEQGKSFRTAGFQRFTKDSFKFEQHQGVFGKQIEIGKPDYFIQGWDLKITGDDDQLQPGNSGSPVVDENDYCVAIITTRQGGKKGIAISLEALKKIWPGMPLDLFEQSTVGTVEKTDGLHSEQSAGTADCHKHQILRANFDHLIETHTKLFAGREEVISKIHKYIADNLSGASGKYDIL
jgi:S1-C subfamily serine protease